MSTNPRIVPLVLGLACGALLAGVPMYYELGAAHSELADANQQISRLQAQNDRLKQAGSQLLAQSEQLAKRDLPVSIKYREHLLLQPGAQLIVQNNAGSDLPVTAEFGRPGAPSVTREIVVPANGWASVDARQGWAFVPGDSIRLHNPQYRDWYNPSIKW